MPGFFILFEPMLNSISKEQLIFAPYYEQYIKLFSGNDILDELLKQHMETIELVTSLDDETLTSAYAPGKWTILDILVHLMDTERIFCYRALRIARGDKQPLSGFDQDNFVINANANNRKILDIVTEFSVLRSNTIELFKSFTTQMLLQEGVANNNPLNVASIPYIICGHELHHRQIIESRYIGKYNN